MAALGQDSALEPTQSGGALETPPSSPEPSEDSDVVWATLAQNLASAITRMEVDQFLILAVATSADHFDEELVQRFGGKTMFGVSKRITPYDPPGYL